MTERERLTYLILNAPQLELPFGSRAQGKTYQTAQNIADHLLANGVIVPPCKLGDTVYVVFGNGIIECIVAQITIEPYAEIQYSFHCYGGMTFDMRFWGDSVFLKESMRSDGEKATQQKHFSPEEVRKMTKEEVRENYSAIIDSMKSWN